MEDLIKRVKKSQIKCYFLSPHLDDAALSCGGLIEELSNHTQITVLNIFTKCGNSNSLSAKKYIQQCGYKSASKLYKDRIKEDKYALGFIKVRYLNLNFIEALWRVKNTLTFFEKAISNIIPEFALMYPTYRFHVIGKSIHSDDDLVIQKILKKVKAIIKGKKCVVFAPMGFGDHADHRLVHALAKELENEVIYYADIPYSFTGNINKRDINLQKKQHKIDYERKCRLISYYKTQITAVFGVKKIPKHKEIYFVPNAKGK